MPLSLPKIRHEGVEWTLGSLSRLLGKAFFFNLVTVVMWRCEHRIINARIREAHNHDMNISRRQEKKKLKKKKQHFSESE